MTGSLFTQCPHRILNGFLGETLSDEILDFVIENEHRMVAAPVGSRAKRRVNSAIRRALILDELGPFQPPVLERILNLAPILAIEFGQREFTPSSFQFEIAAHGDGAFYRRHIDTHIAEDSGRPRQLSMVWYCHRRPKRFGGGHLRLHPFRGDGYTDIAPNHDQLVCFPSWLPHEVMPVTVPGNIFLDWRFAINIWVT